MFYIKIKKESIFFKISSFDRDMMAYNYKKIELGIFILMEFFTIFI